jgi:glycerophosphoryl diester phosphodiesterase
MLPGMVSFAKIHAENPRFWLPRTMATFSFIIALSLANAIPYVKGRKVAVNKATIVAIPLLLALLASYASGLWAGDAFKQIPSTRHPVSRHITVIAHRGASGCAPEHTLAAYRKAMEMKADYIELDLHMTKDGELVAIHDATLARTTNVEQVYPNRSPWRVRDFSLAEIKRLDAGSWFNKTSPHYAHKQYGKEKIPTLQEVIDWLAQSRSKTALYIETKDPNVYPGMEEKLVSILKTNGYLQKGKVIFQSFSETSLRKLKGLVPPNIPLIQLYSASMIRNKPIDHILRRVSSYADGIAPEQTIVTRKLVTKARQYHLIIHPYTVNTTKEMRRQIALGVDGLFTDYPDRLVEVNKKTR